MTHTNSHAKVMTLDSSGVTVIYTEYYYRAIHHFPHFTSPPCTIYSSEQVTHCQNNINT